jgi:predicted N-acyltransferase
VPRRLSAVDVRSVDTVGDVDPREWNSLVPEIHVSLTHEWLHGLEDGSVRSRYFLATGGGRLLGALPAYLWDGIGFAGYDYDPSQLAVDESGAPLPGRGSWFPTLLLGARNGSTTQLLVGRGQLDLLAPLVAAAQEWAGAEGARSSAFLYLDSEARDAVERLELSGAATVALTPETRLALPPDWTTFDDYLATLPQRRRASVRRERRAWREAGAEVVRAKLSDQYEVAGPLLANLHRKYGLPAPASACTAFLREKAEHLDDRSTVFLCTRGDEIAGFSLYYRSGDRAYAGATGFDYGLISEIPFAYFNTVYYEPIPWALETGVRELYFGRQAYATKVARGAALDARWGVVVPPPDVDPGWRAAIDRQTMREQERAREYAEPSPATLGARA